MGEYAPISGEPAVANAAPEETEDEVEPSSGTAPLPAPNGEDEMEEDAPSVVREDVAQCFCLCANQNRHLTVL